MRKFLVCLLVGLLAFAPVTPAWAAIALVTSGIGSAPASGPSTTGALTTTGSTLFVVVVSDDNSNGTGPAVTDSKSNTWTRISRKVNGNQVIQMWYSLPTTVGASHTFSYAGNFSRITVAAFSGTATSSVLDGALTEFTDTTNPSTTIQPGSITPSQANGLLVTGLASNSTGSSPAINGSFTIAQFADNLTYGAGIAYLIQTSAAAANPTWSTYSSPFGAMAQMQAFKDPGGGGGGSTTTPLRNMMGVGQ